MLKNNFSTVLFIIVINCFWASTINIQKSQNITDCEHQSDVLKKNYKLVKKSSTTDGHHDSPQQHLLVNTIDEQEKNRTVIGLDHDKPGNPNNMTRKQFLKISLHYLRMLEPNDNTEDWRRKRKRKRKKKLRKEKKKTGKKLETGKINE